MTESYQLAQLSIYGLKEEKILLAYAGETGSYAA